MTSVGCRRHVAASVDHSPSTATASAKIRASIPELFQMWVKPQHNATVTMRNMAITPKYLNLCRTDECCLIWVTVRLPQNNLCSHDCSASEQSCSL
jgi:hypothetical protein